MTSCSSNNTQTSTTKHVVLCWIKKGALQEDFVNAVKSLKSIPQVKGISIGKQINSIEPIADNSFSLAFTITFDSPADLEIYLKHPEHQKIAHEKLIPALEKAIVYDYQEL